MLQIRTPLMDSLDLRIPLFQAPMAGGATTTDLVVAVCEGGGLGFLAAAYSSPEEIIVLGAEVRARTTRSFGINLFAPVPAPPRPDDLSAALQLLASFHAQLGLDPPQLPDEVTHDHRGQFEAVLETGASMLSFTFGILPAHEIEAAKQSSMLVAGTATTVEEALILESSGVDAVVAQGSEAGAHRGSFAGDFEAAMVGTMALVPQVADAVQIPVVAAGGIMDGRGMVAALALGAQAAQMGTALLTCDEAGVPETHKQAILDTTEDQTTITTAFSGRPARGLINRFVAEAASAPPGSILPYPYQNTLTRRMRHAAAQQGVAELLSLWTGQGVRLARRGSVRELLTQLEKEMAATMERLDANPG